MLIKAKQKRIWKRSLASVIFEYLILSLMISVFSGFFLYKASCSIGEAYFINKGVSVTDIQDMVFHTWLQSLCIAASVLIFLVLFLSLLIQRLSYILSIMKGIERIREQQTDQDVPLIGNDDLTRLAESVNFLAASRRELTRKEQALKEEHETWLRTLSHDIRTPLTSLLSCSELMLGKDSFTDGEIKSYTELVHRKALQISELAARLMEKRQAVWTDVENIRFLLEQLAAEWEEMLEDRFQCSTDITCCADMSGSIDIHSLRRIMDNLVSNIEKYADPSFPVSLIIRSEGQQITIMQTNKKSTASCGNPDSHLIGLESIRSMCSLYDGNVTVEEDSTSFCICIILNIRAL